MPPINELAEAPTLHDQLAAVEQAIAALSSQSPVEEVRELLTRRKALAHLLDLQRKEEDERQRIERERRAAEQERYDKVMREAESLKRQIDGYGQSATVIQQRQIRFTPGAPGYEEAEREMAALREQCRNWEHDLNELKEANPDIFNPPPAEAAPLDLPDFSLLHQKNREREQRAGDDKRQRLDARISELRERLAAIPDPATISDTLKSFDVETSRLLIEQGINLVEMEKAGEPSVAISMCALRDRIKMIDRQIAHQTKHANSFDTSSHANLRAERSQKAALLERYEGQVQQ